MIKCPVCSDIFNNNENLELHFESIHDNYSDLSVLDQKKYDDPKFDILDVIDMFKIMKVDETFDSDTCVICCFKYYVDNQENPDDFKIIKIIPIKLSCCNAIMCLECLQKHINSKFGKLECPFCRRFHYQKENNIFEKHHRNITELITIFENIDSTSLEYSSSSVDESLSLIDTNQDIIKYYAENYTSHESFESAVHLIDSLKFCLIDFDYNNRSDDEINEFDSLDELQRINTMISNYEF